MSNTTFITVGGREIDLLAPRPEDIAIEDVATALSNICRFAGHLPVFYSVAQHCAEIAWRMDTGWPRHTPGADHRIRFAGLLHDAAEGLGFGDMIRPLKRAIDGGRTADIERGLHAVVAMRFGLLLTELIECPHVKLADLRMYATECRDLPGRALRVDLGDHHAEPYPDALVPLAPEAARARFLDAYDWLKDGPE